MYSTYHFKTAEEINTGILDAIKIAFKGKSITIIVEEDETEFELSTEMKNVLDERLEEDESKYLTADESINQLHKKYGL